MEVKSWSYKRDSLAAGLEFLMQSSAHRPPLSALCRVRGERPAPVAFRALWDGARVRDFWLISGVYLVCGASTMGLIGTHLIPARRSWPDRSHRRGPARSHRRLRRNRRYRFWLA